MAVKYIQWWFRRHSDSNCHPTTRSQLRWFSIRPRGRSRVQWRDYISWLAWEHHGREGWGAVSVVSILPPWQSNHQQSIKPINKYNWPSITLSLKNLILYINQWKFKARECLCRIWWHGSGWKEDNNSCLKALYHRLAKVYQILSARDFSLLTKCSKMSVVFEKLSTAQTDGD